MRLTRQIWHGSKLLLPVLGDLYGLTLHGLAGRSHTLLVRVFEDLRKVIRVQRVEHVEKVVARRAFALRISVRKVRHELGVLRELRIEILHAQLVVVRHLDEPDFGFLQQLLLAREDLLQVVLVDHGLVWQIKL